MLQAVSQSARKLDKDYYSEPILYRTRVKVIRKKTYQKPLLYIKIGLILFVYAAFLVFLCMCSAMLDYQIHGLQKEISKLQTENKRLLYSIEQLSSLDRIERIATQELNMSKANWNNSYSIAALPSTVNNTQANEVSDTSFLKVSDKPMQKIYNTFLYLANKHNK